MDVERAEEFLRLFQWDDVELLRKHYPKVRSLYIDYLLLSAYDFKVADELLDSPESVMGYFREAVKRTLGEDVSVNIGVKNVPASRRLLIRDISSRYLNRVISTEGVVREVTDVLPRIRRAAWMCRYCGAVTMEEQTDITLKKPVVCPVCGKRDFELVEEQSEFSDFQKIRIQEPLEYLRGGEQARMLVVYLHDDLVNTVSPGERIVVTGVLRLRKTKERATVHDKYLRALHIESVEKEFEELEPSEEELEEIKSLASSPDIYEKLVKSIAPTIKGHEHIKEAIALQLFGGVKKEYPGGTRIRGNIHILLLGDPGTGKSQLLEYAAKIAPKSFYVAGKTATGAGLTAAAERDEFGEGGWTLKAGVLVLASGGLAAVDEFEKIDANERAALLEAMEQQTVSIAKAGIVTRFKAETAILAAANPKYGHFEPDQHVLEQVSLDNPILTRFDLIFIIKERIERERDREIAEHIIKTHRAGEMRALYESGDRSITREDVEEAEEGIRPEIDIELLRKYIAYARTHVFPVMSDEAASILVDFYQTLRERGAEKGYVPITARQIEALIRLAEASARVRLSNVITKEDAERAKRLFMTSLDEVFRDPETGEIDIDSMYTGMARSKREKLRLILKWIREIAEEKKRASINDILERAEEEGMTREEVMDYIRKLHEMGEIVEEGRGYFRPVE